MPMVGFPLLLIPVAIFNMIVFLMPGVTMLEPIAKLRLMSGADWPITLSDMLLALGIVLLMFEVMKGARPGAKFLTDHLLSLIVFVAAAAEFVQWSRFGTSTFFLLTLLALVDFLAGVALRSRHASSTNASHREAPMPAATEPQFAPSPAQFPEPSAMPSPVAVTAPTAVNAAASVAESVLLDRPEPKFTPVEVTPNGSSPQVSSPGLQPVDGLLPSTDAPPR